jgi:hypothetical protein
MGRPYALEMELLPSTYAWSFAKDISALTNVVSAAATLPLLAIGSGGSLTAAHFASWLHQIHTGLLAKAVSPIEVVNGPLSSGEVAVLFLSARGGNSDILSAFRHVVAREPRRLALLCCRTNSPLGRLGKKHRFVDRIEFDLPSSHDGFLATNSLLAFATVLSRSYGLAFAADAGLPSDLAELVHPGLPTAKYLRDLKEICEPLWARETLVVLFGPTSEPAAFDLEAKFTEAALGSVQLADYRNFAHGRHHWLAKRGDSSAVLAIITDDDRHIAEKTLRLLPTQVPQCQLDIQQGGVRASLSALASALQIVAFAGKARGIDPGRPGVPAFGRKIYNLRAFSRSARRDSAIPNEEAIAIERKAQARVERLAHRSELDLWRQSYQTFVDRLRTAVFRAIVFDYDGTLCDAADRFTGLGDDVTRYLLVALREGMSVGVATGRGKSVKSDLRRVVPKSQWSSVVVGYYNGAEIALLDEDSHPASGATVCTELEPVAAGIKSDTRLSRICKPTFRTKQITLEPQTGVAAATAWPLVEQIVHAAGVPGISVLKSSHSIDVLAPGVSKRNVEQRVRELMGRNGSSPVLCIGDRGAWPGNDAALLAGPYSLSVDEVSPDPSSCWNLAPPGTRGVQATQYYLRRLTPCRGGMRYKVAAPRRALS